MNETVKTNAATALPPLAKDAIEFLLETGKALSPVYESKGGEPLMLVPKGYTIESVAKYVPPTRIKENVILRDVGSFCRYVNRFRDDGTLLFAVVTDATAEVRAVLDYHFPNADGLDDPKPRYGSHTARLTLENTTEWKRWTEANGRKMDQVTFATWLEDNALLLTSPSGAELLELVMTLEGKQEVRFNSAVRLNNGKNALRYDEDVALTGGGGTTAGAIELPNQVRACVAPFHGMDPVFIHARLKYRIEQRKVSFWLESIALHNVVREAVKTVLEQIQSATTLEPLIGGL